ncbi:hypothetical protein R1flu_006634 [Riccia fluitans]|uniref:Exostosin GT47 domain-containing protein n=1 Tax=Riccia fluitans TaxID=41844 RepID=A0ABD1YXE9_9MARC
MLRFFGIIDRRRVVKVALSITAVLTLLSFYQSCPPCNSTWTSLNILGSRPSFLPAPQLPLHVQEEGGPADAFLTAAFSSPGPRADDIFHLSNTSIVSFGSEESVSSNTAPAPRNENSGGESGNEDEVSSSFQTTEANEEQIDSSRGLVGPGGNHVLVAVDLEKVFPNGSKLELDLLAAKLAIEAATPEDADRTLYEPAYNNLSAFSLDGNQSIRERITRYVPPESFHQRLREHHCSEVCLLESYSRSRPFLVSCHDWGPATAREQKDLNNNAVKVVCNANLSEEFVLGKDASLPEIYLHSRPFEVGGPPARNRAILAFFAGQMHGHVRHILLKHWADKDSRMKIFDHIPATNRSDMLGYIRHMKNTKYCLCPAGYEVNSPRIVEAIYYDCVPVIIADNFILPFNDVLNWSSFSLTVPEDDIPNLRDILLSIPEKTYRRMQRRLSKIRKHFIWHEQPVEYDAFHMILHSVWASRLNHIHP